MKKEMLRVILSALIVPFLFLIVWIICSCNHKGEGVGVEYIIKNGAVRHDWDIKMDNILERGYVLYRDIPQELQKISEIPEFVSKKYDEDGELVEENNADFSMLNDLDYVKKYNGQIVTGNVNDFYAIAVLTIDSTKDQFQDKDLIQKIEESGFSGFSKHISAIEKKIQVKSEAHKSEEDPYYTGGSEVYYIDCQGVRFQLTRIGADAFSLKVDGNLSYCYCPEKYVAFVNQQMASGDYYLLSSCAGGEREILTFAKNNCVTDMWARTEKEEGGSNGKAISFVFENGQLVDYFVAICGAQLQWDDADDTFVANATKGIDKELEEKPRVLETYYDEAFRVYRTKE